MRRIFIGIDLPDEARAKVTSLIEKLKKEISAVYVSPNKLHVTIKFLGNTPLSDDKIVQAANSVELNQRIIISGLGGFPNEIRARVVFADVKSDLSGVYSSLCGALGVEPEKSFHPHVTLCRKRNFVDITKHRIDFDPIEFEAKKLTVYNSDYATYSRLN
jgi:2'-5' RNA ligase